MVDYKTVVAGILYPYVKNGSIKIEQVKNIYDTDIYDILSTILKLEMLKINTKQSQTQNVKDMFIALAKDIRVIILKLAIEVHKTIILDKYSKDEQKQIMQQINDIYSPLSAVIGIGYIKNRLENELFLFFKPLEYAELNKQLHKYVEARNNQIKVSIEKIKQEILPIKAQVYGRQKQISSIYKKIENKTKDLNLIYDILAIRVIVESVEECYAVLGKIHALYRPLGKFKDYIAQPKENGYQSLHTTVIVENGDPLEIQIRTIDMHTYAEYGFAAHWVYKERRKVNESDKKMSYIRSVMELYKDKSPEELMSALKIDVYSGNIFCQSPQGKILQFPEGATPIDFGYAIHSKIGDTCVGAKINDKMVPLTTTLQNGDIVEIVTNVNSKGPSRDWLKIAKTAEARTRINAFFKREMKDDNIKKGKSILEAQAKAKNIVLARVFKDDYLESVFDKYSLNSVDDLYASVGYGSLTANQVLSRLTAAQRENEVVELDANEIVNSINANTNNNRESRGASTVNVLGYANLMTKFAKCCNPLPGDEIIGYVSRGKGVTIHRVDCDALLKSENDRLIECSWNTNNNNSFVGALTIISSNTPSAIAVVTKKFSDLKIPILSLKNLALNKEELQLSITLNVKRKDELEEVIKKLKQLSIVHDIFRSK